MLTRALVTLTLAASLVSRSEAQSVWLGRPAVASDSVPQSIREAEDRGSRHPTAVTNNADRDHNAYTGSRERTCVHTDAGAMRSGDFVAGPFDLYSTVWRQGYGKIWWQPNEMPAEPPILIVRATRLDEPAEGRVFESRTIAGPSGRMESKATSVNFYPTGIRLPTVGRWMMVATAGNNWGCFILTVH